VQHVTELKKAKLAWLTDFVGYVMDGPLIIYLTG
jgi:hypothetical protein